MQVVIECGQRWYWLHSWHCRYPQHNHERSILRTIDKGFAIGPIMVWWGEEKEIV